MPLEYNGLIRRSTRILAWTARVDWFPVAEESMDPKLKTGLLAGGTVAAVALLVVLLILVNLPQPPSPPAPLPIKKSEPLRPISSRPTPREAAPAPSPLAREEAAPAQTRKLPLEEEDPAAAKRPTPRKLPLEEEAASVGPSLLTPPQPKELAPGNDAGTKGSNSAKKPGTAEADNQEPDPVVSAMAKDLKSRKLADRIRAAEGLAQQGSRGKPASRALCEALLDVDVRVQGSARAALEKVNPLLHALVVPILTDRNIKNRLDAIHKIEQLGSDGKPAVPILLFFKNNVVNSGEVVKALVAVAADDPDITNQFISWLTKDSSDLVRLEVATRLPEMKDGKEGIKALTLALQNDKYPLVRVASARALGEFGPMASEAIKALTAAQKDPTPEVRDAAGKALEKITKGN